MSDDYSNLFRGGGVTSGRSGSGKSKGPKILLYFVLLCFITVGAIWFSGYFDAVDESPDNGVSDSSATSSETENGSATALNGSQPNSDSASLAMPNHGGEATKRSAKPQGLSKDIKTATALLEKEDYVNAIDAASSILDSGVDENTPEGRRATEILGDANIKIFMTDIPSPRKKLYTIKSGDNLISIANRFGTTVAAIQVSNGLTPSNPVIFPGKTLYIYSGEWEVKVSRGKYKLYLYDKGKLFKTYSIGVGRQGRTPLGSFIIQNKQKEPVWYNNGRTIPYGEKENVLGTRWMALKPTGKTNMNLSGYGIHGTWSPETIGTQCSNGCVRMRNDDVNELFTILPYHTKVTIEE